MKISKIRKAIISMSFIFILLLGISPAVYPYANGVAGRTLLGSPGCTCHSSSSNSAVVVSVTGPTTLTAGQTATYTLSVSRNSGTFSTGGIDIAVTSGTLGIGSSTGIKILSGEVVHSAKFTGATTKTFTFTAPNTSGTVTMAVTGAAGTNPPAWNHGTSLTITVNPATGISKTGEIISSYSLAQNFPNPFNPVTKINYSIPKSSNVSLKIFDILGREAVVLVNEMQESGLYSVNFDASSLTSGVYYYKLEAGEFTSIRKMTLIK
ncbi:MAG: T9SS type A sorting domain-containing protein [Ignavibacteriae bacterium]|nr:T9SS type A sorting domain-containing protein [Ignavibacteriota bacterium]